MTAQTSEPSIETTISEFKRLLVEDKHRIDLHDFLHQQVTQVCARLAEDNFPLDTPALPQQERHVRIHTETD